MTMSKLPSKSPMLSSKIPVTFPYFSARSSLFRCFPITVSPDVRPERLRAHKMPSFPSPMTATFSSGPNATCSLIPYAAANGSTKTASTSDTFSGTSNRFWDGSVKYSACAPSRPLMPRTVLFGQCLESPDKHNEQAPQPAFISPTTRFPTRLGSSARSTIPTNSWPIIPSKPAYPRAISRSVLQIPDGTTRTSASPFPSGHSKSANSNLPCETLNPFTFPIVPERRPDRIAVYVSSERAEIRHFRTDGLPFSRSKQFQDRRANNQVPGLSLLFSQAAFFLNLYRGCSDEDTSFSTRSSCHLTDKVRSFRRSFPFHFQQLQKLLRGRDSLLRYQRCQHQYHLDRARAYIHREYQTRAAVFGRRRRWLQIGLLMCRSQLLLNHTRGHFKIYI